MKNKMTVPIILGGTALFLAIIFSSTIGSANISALDSLKIILNRLINIFDEDLFSINSQIIVLNVRLPRILGAGLCGMGLSLSGIIFQSILRNPMAEPYVLGVSSGAALGATISIVFNLFATPLFALIGGILSSLMVLFISGNNLRSSRILLYGISFNFFLSSIITLLISLNANRSSDVMFWTMGSFSTMTYFKVIVLFIFILFGIIGTFIHTRELNIFTFGAETAITLGVDIKKYRIILLTIASLITGIIVSFSGVIGFVGLIIPHISRLIIGSEHKNVIIVSIPLGGIFMILCDTIARSLLTNELPVGVITSVIGAPIFIYLLKKGSHGY